ncbi:MAG: hypothetical protein ACPGVD_06720 [Flavobacteriales bacterium]
MNFNQSNSIARIAHFLLAIIIDIAITFPILFMSAYNNAKTYHGNEGHNNAFVTLLISAPILYLIFRIWKRKNNANAYFSSMLVLIIHIVLFIVFTIEEYNTVY